MGISSLWSSRKDSPEVYPTVSMREIEDQFDIIKVVDDVPGQEFMIVTAKESYRQELGTSSPSPFTSFTRQEYNPLLQGLRGLEQWDQIRKGDGTARGSLRALKTPALSAKWFIEPAGDSDEERELADKIWCNLTEWMTIGWIQVLTEALLMLDFGYYMFEIVYENVLIDGKWFTKLSKLAPRHPMDVKEWKFDEHGGPNGVVMYVPVSAENPNGEQFIEIDRLLVFSFDREAGNLEGVSALRSAYKHWYFKEQLYKIDAIQKERHGIGIPVIKLPVGYDKTRDKAAAEELGRNIRTNERAHIVLPPSWDIYMLKLEGQPVNVMESIEHHNKVIRENVLVNFIGEGAKQDDLVMFFKASRYIADLVAEDFNLYLIRKLSVLNGASQWKYPKLRVRRIGEVADWRTLTFALRNLVGANILSPDDRLEAEIRDEMDLPVADPATKREVATPQAPGGGGGGKQQGQKAGLPRQTPPGQGRRRGPFGTPAGNGGTDGGGR